MHLVKKYGWVRCLPSGTCVRLLCDIIFSHRPNTNKQLSINISARSLTLSVCKKILVVTVYVCLFSATESTTPTTTTSTAVESKFLSVFAKILAFAWLLKVLSSTISQWLETWMFTIRVRTCAHNQKASPIHRHQNHFHTQTPSRRSHYQNLYRSKTWQKTKRNNYKTNTKHFCPLPGWVRSQSPTKRCVVIKEILLVLLYKAFSHPTYSFAARGFWKFWETHPRKSLDMVKQQTNNNIVIN